MNANNRRFSAAIPILAALVGIVGGAQAQTYDAAADFSIASNPNGRWSYGQRVTYSSPFAPFALARSNVDGTPIHGWESGPAPGTNPTVFHNSSSSAVTAYLIEILPGRILMHPGPSGECAVIRWSAPVADYYSITGFFRGINFGMGTTTDVHVLVNGVSVFDAYINGFGVQPVFSHGVQLSAGASVEFAVGFGTNGRYEGDSTGLEATIQAVAPPVCTPTPADIVSWWRAEGDGTDFIDGNHGTLQNGTTFAAGKVGQAFAFDGANDYVRVADAPSLRPPSLTIDGWFNFSNLSGLRHLVAKPVGLGPRDSFGLYYHAPNLICFVGTESANSVISYP